MSFQGAFFLSANNLYISRRHYRRYPNRGKLMRVKSKKNLLKAVNSKRIDLFDLENELKGKPNNKRCKKADNVDTTLPPK